MKNKLMLTALLGLLLVGSFSYAEESDDEAKKRLLKEYEKVQKEKEKEAERAAKEAEEAAKKQAEEGTQSAQEIANQATENADGTVVEGGEVAVVQEEVAPKKSRKNMTESEKMDEEIQRITADNGLVKITGTQTNKYLKYLRILPNSSIKSSFPIDVDFVIKFLIIESILPFLFNI